MESAPNSRQAIMHGNQSLDTFEVHRSIRACRKYVRRHGIPEGMFRSWTSGVGWPERIKFCWQTFEELHAVLKQYGLATQTCWHWPTCVMVVAHKNSGQWVSIRCMAVTINGTDLPSARLIAQCSALLVFLGAGNQHEVPDFETCIEGLAKKALGNGLG